MSPIFELLNYVFQGVTIVSGVVTSYSKIAAYCRQRTVNGKLENVRELLQDLGSQSENSIRQIVEAYQFNGPLTRDQKEDLIGLLINLSRGARFLTTQGSPRSTFVRCEALVDNLLEASKNLRRAGENVAIGLDDWKLKQFLGKGTFGEVWLGVNAGFPDFHTFKFFTHDQGKEWLSREQGMLFQLKSVLGSHPNIVGFLDVATSARPFPYLLLEYVGGGSLEEWILDRSLERPRLDKREVMEGIIKGLAQAHAKGIYHRDMKPSNVLLTEAPDIQPKIADFGLATAEFEPAVLTGGSQVGPVGTTMYLPPEAQRPFADRHPSQDDVFAVGVIWYQLETEKLDRPPYDFADQLEAVGLERHTIGLIARCLAQPRSRYKDACALEEAMLHTVPPEGWEPPEGCFEVQYLVREYLAGLPR